MDSTCIIPSSIIEIYFSFKKGVLVKIPFKIPCIHTHTLSYTLSGKEVTSNSIKML